MKHTLLITGAEGFIGKRLTKLLENEYEVIGVDIKSNNDVTNYWRMNDLFKTTRPDYVVHLAAGLDNKIFNNLKNNIYGTKVMASLCKKYKVNKLVFTSSAAVYGNAHQADENGVLHPINNYGLAKKYCERVIKNKNIPYIILRFANVYGKGGKGVISKWKESAEYNLAGKPNYTRDFVHVTDVCRAIEKGIKSEVCNETFNISTGIETDLAQLSSIMNIDTLNELKPNKKEIEFSSLCNEKAQKILRWNPKVDLKTGVEQYELL